MSRLTPCFEALRKSGRKAVIPYIVAGDPTVAATVPMLHSLVAAGANVLELGVPFSDPMSEGPVIQLAHERAPRSWVGYPSRRPKGCGMQSPSGPKVYPKTYTVCITGHRPVTPR